MKLQSILWTIRSIAILGNLDRDAAEMLTNSQRNPTCCDREHVLRSSKPWKGLSKCVLEIERSGNGTGSLGWFLNVINKVDSGALRFVPESVDAIAVAPHIALPISPAGKVQMGVSVKKAP